MCGLDVVRSQHYSMANRYRFAAEMYYLIKHFQYTMRTYSQLRDNSVMNPRTYFNKRREGSPRG